MSDTGSAADGNEPALGWRREVAVVEAEVALQRLRSRARPRRGGGLRGGRIDALQPVHIGALRIGAQTLASRPQRPRGTCRTRRARSRHGHGESAAPPLVARCGEGMPTAYSSGVSSPAFRRLVLRIAIDDRGSGTSERRIVVAADRLAALGEIDALRSVEGDAA